MVSAHNSGELETAKGKSSMAACAAVVRLLKGPNIEALSESARLLHWGGQLVLETGIAAPVEEIVARLRAVGFIGIDVARLGLLRFTAVLGGP
jgi:hypothetical protein